MDTANEDLCRGFIMTSRDRPKLGSMRVVEGEGGLVQDLGPEPLDPAFTPEALAERLSGRSAPIKALLCDQAVVAGIGNIYARRGSCSWPASTR